MTKFKPLLLARSFEKETLKYLHTPLTPCIKHPISSHFHFLLIKQFIQSQAARITYLRNGKKRRGDRISLLLLWPLEAFFYFHSRLLQQAVKGAGWMRRWQGTNLGCIGVEHIIVMLYNQAKDSWVLLRYMYMHNYYRGSSKKPC